MRVVGRRVLLIGDVEGACLDSFIYDIADVVIDEIHKILALVVRLRNQTVQGVVRVGVVADRSCAVVLYACYVSGVGVEIAGIHQHLAA
jgi:hypothetical protein